MTVWHLSIHACGLVRRDRIDANEHDEQQRLCVQNKKERKKSVLTLDWNPSRSIVHGCFRSPIELCSTFLWHGIERNSKHHVPNADEHGNWSIRASTVTWLSALVQPRQRMIDPFSAIRETSARCSHGESRHGKEYQRLPRTSSNTWQEDSSDREPKWSCIAFITELFWNGKMRYLTVSSSRNEDLSFSAWSMFVAVYRNIARLFNESFVKRMNIGERSIWRSTSMFAKSWAIIFYLRFIEIWSLRLISIRVSEVNRSCQTFARLMKSRKMNKTRLTWW